MSHGEHADSPVETRGGTEQTSTAPNPETGLQGPRWFICDEQLEHGGKKLHGPYTTQDDALRARELFERLYEGTYWVDEELA